MRHLCVTIGGERFALAVKDVHEVAPAVAARAVPGAPGWCRGFACARGSWIPLVHAAVLLGLPAATPTTATRTLLLHPAGGQPLLLEVDAVLELIDLDDRGSHPGLGVDGLEWLGGVHTHAGASLQTIDAELLAQHPALNAVRDTLPPA